MKKENNIISESRKAGYAAPSTRIINVRVKTSILSVSDPTTETEDGGNI